MRQITTPVAAASGPTTIDLSGSAADSDTDSIINSLSSTVITLNKSGTGLDVPARFLLATLTDGDVVTINIKRDGILSGDKSCLFVGVHSASGIYGAGINAQGSNVPQTMDWDGTTVNFVGLRTNEDTTCLTFIYRGSSVEIRNAPIHYQDGGTTITNGSGATAVAVSGTVSLALWVSINDALGGTTTITYAGTYTIQSIA